MRDSFGRNIDYMRISITDRCNLRCRYCMPNGIETVAMNEILTYEEILQICKIAVSLGIVKFKITGGEPLVRKGCLDLIRQIKALPGVEAVTLTTNGILLGRYLPELIESGVDGINVSLDTLQPARFLEITQFNEFSRVLNGIEVCLDAGLKIKVNTVLQKGLNDDEWQDLAELARNRKLDVRFIELMPIGDGKIDQGIAGDLLLEKFRTVYPGMTKDTAIHGNGPAKYYRIPGFQGSIGFISAIHGVFCAACNRIRMTSTGEIKPCLCFDDHVSVKQALRRDDYDEVQRLLKQAIQQKPGMHCFDTEGKITENKKMAQIGG